MSLRKMASTTCSLPKSLCSLMDSGRLSRESVESRPSLLILRHSDRPALPPMSAGGELFLTELGKARARLLGERLHELRIQPGAVLMTTPMTRTAQTLLSICSGARWQDRMESIEVSVRAFGIGSIFERHFQFDDILAKFTSGGDGAAKLKKIAESDLYRVFNKVASGQLPVPGIRPCAEASCAQMRFFADVLERQRACGQDATDERELSIVLAHDLNLAYLLAHYFKVEFTEETWPPFLDGVLLQLDTTDEGSDRIKVYYGDKEIDVELGQLPATDKVGWNPGHLPK